MARDNTPYTVTSRMPRIAVATRISSSVKPRRDMSDRRVTDEIHQFAGAWIALIVDDTDHDFAHFIEPRRNHLTLPAIARIPVERAARVAEALEAAAQHLKLDLADQLARQQRGAGEVLVAGHHLEIPGVQSEQAYDAEGQY